MNNKAKQLADLYNELAEKKTGFLYDDLASERGPDLKSDLSKWQVIDSVKIIDENMIKESGIDCEYAFFKKDDAWLIWSAPLTEDIDGCNYYRVRQDHWFYNIWDECPLPEGLIFDIRSYDVQHHFKCNVYDLSHDWSNVLAFKVVGVEEGYSYD